MHSIGVSMHTASAVTAAAVCITAGRMHRISLHMHTAGRMHSIGLFSDNKYHKVCHHRPSVLHHFLTRPTFLLRHRRILTRLIRQLQMKERLHNLNSVKNLWNWTKPTESSRISVRDVADRFWGWQQLTNYLDPEKKIGALGGDILKKQRFLENYTK